LSLPLPFPFALRCFQLCQLPSLGLLLLLGSQFTRRWPEASVAGRIHERLAECDEDAASVLLVGKSERSEPDGNGKYRVHPETGYHQEVGKERDNHGSPKSFPTTRLLTRRSKKGCNHSAARHRYKSTTKGGRA